MNAAILGAGLDRLTGGAGIDTFLFKAADLASDTVHGGLGEDVLFILGAGALSSNALRNVPGMR